MGTGILKNRSTSFWSAPIVATVTIIWKLGFTVYLYGFWNKTTPFAVTFVKIFSTLGALEARTTYTPIVFNEGQKPMDLECFFSGFPLPLQVHWYKDDKVITNGTEGIYHTENKRPKNGEETLRSRLSLPPGREELEGIYNCRAKNSIPGWQSEVSKVLQLIYVCKLKPITILRLLMKSMWLLKVLKTLWSLTLLSFAYCVASKINIS